MWSVNALVMWAVPRTVSTAFERMMIERGDHLVLDEPWSRAYYLGPQRRSGRFPLTFPESTYPAVTRSILELAAERPIFVKDMAYHALPGLTDDALDGLTHSFLIRRPAAALRSLHREWPDFTDDEAGYAAQRALFDRVCTRTGSAPAVVDSDELRADPAGVVAAWCERVGIDHRPESLTWRAGMRAEWPLWRDWYRNASDSTGFAPPAAGAPDSAASTPARVEEAVRAATPHFEHLRRHAIPSPDGSENR